MNADYPTVVGIPPAEKLDGDEKMQAHREKLATEYEQFVRAVEGESPELAVAAGDLADPSKLPKGALELVVITPLSGVFSTSTRTLYVTIEGPIVKKFSKGDVAAASPVRVTFADIPQGTYKVTAEYGARTMARDIDVKRHTQVLDFVMQ